MSTLPDVVAGRQMRMFAAAVQPPGNDAGRCRGYSVSRWAW